MRIRSGLTAAVVLSALTGALSAPAGAQTQTPTSDDDVHVIVVVHHGLDVAATARAQGAHAGGHVSQVFTNVLGGFEYVGSAQAVEALSRAPGIDAVVPNESFSLSDVAGTGFFRIQADKAVNDVQGPYRGAGARVALIDSGVDTTHPDLAPNVDLANSYNCIQPGTAPQDDNGHGTHVAGIAAAAFNANGSGIVGVAPSARIVALKAFDANGNGTTAQIVCALNRLAAVISSSPMPTALNMSFADVGTDSLCDDGIATDVLHEALCDVVSAGTSQGVPVIPVAAAGNDSVDAANTIPAAFHDVITVSALADDDGTPGGLAGCQYVSGEFNYECDDTVAAFSNWGSVVDVAAPGVDIYSDLPGGFGYLSGTSMAAPHVTGVVALMLGANPTLDFTAARTMLLQTGECPDGTQSGDDAACSGQGQWQQTANQSLFDPVGTKPDPDGTPEPLVNAYRAARAAAASGPGPVDAAPVVSITAPSPGAVVSGTTTVSGSATDDHGVTQVEVFVDGTSIGTTTPSSSGTWSLGWNALAVADGSHILTAVVTDTIGQQTTSAAVTVTVSNTARATALHVANLTATATSAKRWTATATVMVVDNLGNAAASSTVTFSVDVAGKSTRQSCVTGTDGRCSVSTKSNASSVSFSVTGVAKSGFTYDASANAITTVTIARA